MDSERYFIVDDTWRFSGTLTVPRANPQFGELAAAFPPEMIPADGLGVAWLQSPLMGALCLDTVAETKAAHARAERGIPWVPSPTGRVLGDWPGGPWRDHWPKGGWWHQTGEGIITEHGSVTVYEHGGFDDTGCPAVHAHCSVCHDDELPWVSDGPDTRWDKWRQARRHVQSGCKQPDPDFERRAAEVVGSIAGTRINPAGLWARTCTECGTIARLREAGAIAKINLKGIRT